MKVLVHHDGTNTEKHLYFFQLQTEDFTLQSEHFATRTACLEHAYRTLILLKSEPEKPVYLSKNGQTWTLNVVGELALRLVAPPDCHSAEEANDIVKKIRTAAKSPSELLDVQEEADRYTYTPPEETAPLSTEEPQDNTVPDPKEIDDYHPELAILTEETGLVSYQKLVNGKQRYFFQLNDKSGQGLLFSEAYQSEHARDEGIASVRINANKRAQYEFREDNGQHYFVLKAANHQEIGRSRPFTDPKKMERTVFWLRLLSKGSPPVPSIQSAPAPGTGTQQPNFEWQRSSQSPCEPIFKPLEPHGPGDIALFWGRKKELNDLYKMTFDTNLLLLYGAGGVGKSSIVNCGLPNKFNPIKWYGIPIQRGDNINQSLHRRLQAEWERIRPKEVTPQTTPESSTATEASYPLPGQSPPPDEGAGLLQLLQQIHKTSFKPIYLIFDDLHQLLAPEGDLPPDPQEQEQFFRFLQELSESDTGTKAILVIDEQYLAHLTSFEDLVPNVMENRYRLEQLSTPEIGSGIQHSLAHLHQQHLMQTPDAAATSEKIMAQMGGTKQQKVGMSCMQIYLHQLHERACKRNNEGEVPMIDDQLIREAGPPRRLIKSYFKDQQALLGRRKKQPQADIQAIRDQEARLQTMQKRCLPTMAVVPFWIYWILGAPLIVFFPFLIIDGPDGPDGPALDCMRCNTIVNSKEPDPQLVARCRTVLESDDCNDCLRAINIDSCSLMFRYLEKYGMEGECFETISRIVNRSCNCDVPMDSLERKFGTSSDSLCILYQNYLNLYGEHGNCSSLMREYVERHCINTYDCDQIAFQLSNVNGDRTRLSARERAKLDDCECESTRVRGREDCKAYEEYLAKYGSNGKCSDEFIRKLKECDACEQVRREVRSATQTGDICEIYTAYISRYGKNGKCYNEFNQALQKLDCGVPMGDICYLKATDVPVSWNNSHTQCPTGYKLICVAQLNYLIDKFYGGDLGNAYNYAVERLAKDEKLNLNNIRGFWTATEYSDNDAYSFEIDSKLQKVRPSTPLNKQEKLPCLCIKPGPNFEKSAISQLPCLSKSLSN